MFARLTIFFTVAFALLSGCVLHKARQQQSKQAEIATLRGTVRTEHASTNSMVVVLLRRDGEKTEVFDHFVVDRPGAWYFRVSSGTWHLAAFEDVSGDLIFQPDEPAPLGCAK